MPIEVSCPSCKARMRVPDTAAGKKVRCPKCQQGVISVPAAEAAGGDAATMFSPTSPLKAPQKLTASGPVATPKAAPAAKAKVDKWTMQTDDGQTYGPVPKTELDQWYAEGRITADCQLLREGADQWQWASEVYPELAAEGGAPAAGGAPAGAGEAGGGDPMFDFLGGGGGHDAPAGGGDLDFGAPAAAGPAAPATASSSTSTRKGAKGKKGKGKNAKVRDPEEGEVSSRTKVLALVLCVFTGFLGGQRFYLGYTLYGILQLCSCGGLGIWTLIDIIMIALDKLPDANGLPLQK